MLKKTILKIKIFIVYFMMMRTNTISLHFPQSLISSKFLLPFLIGEALVDQFGVHRNSVLSLYVLLIIGK